VARPWLTNTRPGSKSTAITSAVGSVLFLCAGRYGPAVRQALLLPGLPDKRYVEGGKLIGSLGGGAIGTHGGTAVSKQLCLVILGAATRGFGATACVALGAGLGGWAGGEIGGDQGETLGDVIYGAGHE
jgi:hypothetical protein